MKMFAELPKNRTEFVSVTNGSPIIRIHSPTNSKVAPLEYKPDATIVLRNRQKIVFQVLAAQARKNREIEADMMRAFLSPEVSVIVFVTESSVYAKNVERISEILADSLSAYAVKDEMMPITVSLIVPKSIR